MSRSGYTYDDYGQWHTIMYRGRVASAARGKRGQEFLKELLSALDAMPNNRLICEDLEANGEVCALGAIARERGIDVSGLDPEDSERVAKTFGIADALAREIVYLNDECAQKYQETPEARYERMRREIAGMIKP